MDRRGDLPLRQPYGPICLVREVGQQGAKFNFGDSMRLLFRPIPAAFVLGLALSALPQLLLAQSALVTSLPPVADVPDAPQPQSDVAALDFPGQQGAQAPAAAGSSNSQPAPQQPAGAVSQREKAEQQIKEQETQRLVGVVPMSTFPTGPMPFR